MSNCLIFSFRVIVTSPDFVTGLVVFQLLQFLYNFKNPTSKLPDEFRHQDELFSRIGADQLLVMVRCLHESHDFAKRFNSNDEQRMLLWKAGQ